jgi:WD40 repeat protein
MWDLRHLEQDPALLPNLVDAVWALAFSPDGQRLAMGYPRNSVQLCDLNGREKGTTLRPGAVKNPVSQVAFSSDGRRLAACVWGNGAVRLWDLGQLDAEPKALSSPGGGRTALAFSGDGQRLACSAGQTVQLWDLRQGDRYPVVALRGHEGQVSAVAFTADSQQLLSASADSTVRLWDMGPLNAVPTVLPSPEGPILAVRFSPDGRMLALGGFTRTVHLRNLSPPHALTMSWRDSEGPGSYPGRFAGRQGIVASVAFSPDLEKVAFGNTEHAVRLRNLRDPKAAPTILRDPGGTDRPLPPGNSGSTFVALVFGPDAQQVASGGQDGTVRVWNLVQRDTGPVLLTGHRGAVLAMAFSPDSQQLASGGLDGTIRVWALRQPGADPAVLTGHEGPIWSVAFSPDGRWLASGGKDSTVRLWDLRKARTEPVILRGHDDLVLSVAFSPDGQWLASGSSDRTVRLWNVEELQSLPIVLRGPEGPIGSVAFSPDGQQLLSGSYDFTARIWIARTDVLAKMVCKKVRRNLTLEEWHQFVGTGIPYERTCPNLPSGEGAPADAPAALLESEERE